MSAISPCLWFDDELEEAMEFFCALFPDSSIGTVSRHGDAGPGEPGTVMAADWTMHGMPFRGINGGPEHATFTEAISLSVACADQAEVEDLWDALTADGGEEGPCGWLKDRFGLSWQIVPDRLGDLLSDPDPARARAALQAMLSMRKIVVADLESAAASGAAG